jgi:hypothetical protein
MGAVECCRVVRAGSYLDGLNGDGQLDVLVVFGQLVLRRPVSGGARAGRIQFAYLVGKLEKVARYGTAAAVCMSVQWLRRLCRV